MTQQNKPLIPPVGEWPPIGSDEWMIMRGVDMSPLYVIKDMLIAAEGNPFEFPPLPDISPDKVGYSEEVGAHGWCRYGWQEDDNDPDN